MSIQSRLIAGFVALLIGIAIGWKVCSWRDQATMDAKDKAIIAAQNASQSIAIRYETERQQQAQSIAELQKKVRIAHAKNPSSACVLDGDGLRDISDAIDASR